MKKVGLFIFVAALAMLVGAIPAFAGKKVLSEGDLDLITAAGQPEVIIAGSANLAAGGTVTVTVIQPTSPVTKLLSQDIELVLADTSQQNLRALVLNNVVGENIVASGVNIQAGPTSGTGSQSNEVNQSWGSTLDIGGSAASAASINISGKCVACTNTAGTSGTVGGNIDISGKAVATTNNAGGSAGSRRSIYSDEIIFGTTITKTDNTFMELDLLGSSQSGLAALVVNNVSGLNLVANALNIASGNISLATGIAAQANPGLGTISTQTNTVRQYRGTPIAHP